MIAHERPNRVATDQRIPLKPGTFVEHYLIEKVIGSGGFGVVYRCFDIKSNESIVLKEYFPNQVAHRLDNNHIEPIDNKARRPFQIGISQFFAEAYALSKINHPNVINILNVFRANNSVYMVSKLEEGKDLKWFIRQQGGLGQTFIQKAILPVISGVYALHKNQMLHLDVKPSNIFLRNQGGPLLLDFGATKTMDKKERFASFQTLTPGFAPIEQHTKQELGPSSDIYALGATIYACITGRAPPSSLERQEKNAQLLLSSHQKKFTPSVLAAIKWSLELDIDKRPPTLPHFANLLLKDTEWESFTAYEEDLFNRHRAAEAASAANHKV